MRRTLLVSMFCCLFAWPASAQAVTLVNPDWSVATPYQGWANAAKVPTVDEYIVVWSNTSECDRPSLVWGCASKTGWIAVAGPHPRFTLMHELGHVYDFRMPEWKRRVFERVAGFGAGYDAERFADQYAICALRSRLRERVVIAGDEPEYFTVRQQRRVCRLIRQPN